MSSASPGDRRAALERVLFEVIDAVGEVRQARRQVPVGHALQHEVDQLFGDLQAWARLVAGADGDPGVSAPEATPSAARRPPANLWAGAASDEEVRLIIAEHLERLGQHVAAARAVRDDHPSRPALAELEHGVRAHVWALTEIR